MLLKDFEKGRRKKIYSAGCLKWKFRQKRTTTVIEGEDKTLARKWRICEKSKR